MVDVVNVVDVVVAALGGLSFQKLYFFVVALGALSFDPMENRVMFTSFEGMENRSMFTFLSSHWVLFCLTRWRTE